MADKKKNASRSQMADLKPRGSERAQPARSARATVREERKEPVKQQRKEPAKQINRPERREAKAPPSLWLWFRNTAFGRFIIEAYYELRHKVTWPTPEEARNMTIAVIALSLVIGGILALADYGLYNLFFLISGAK
jgi:preprotein translocase SecE subunit